MGGSLPKEHGMNGYTTQFALVALATTDGSPAFQRRDAIGRKN